MCTINRIFVNIVFMILVISLPSCQKSSVRPSSNPSIDRIALIIDERNHVRAPLVELLRLTNQPQRTNLFEVIASTQQSWTRPAGTERMHLVEQHQTNRQSILKALDEIGLVERVMPRNNDYEYVLVLGATYKAIKGRLAFLEQLHNNGLRFKKIALLGSERPLEPNSELKALLRENILTSIPATEIEMMEAVFRHSSLAKYVPTENVIRIAPTMKTIDGRLVRPNTQDTVESFSKLVKTPAPTLVVTNQPYLLRQDLVVRNTLPPHWPIETVGAAATSRTVTGVFLDELTKTLYELGRHLQLSPRVR